MNTMISARHLRGFLATAALAAIATGLATAAKAGDFLDVRSVTVQYGDLNLSNAKGAETLYGRIVAAAHVVCDRGEFDLASRATARACLSNAIADAVTKIGHPELIAVYDAKTHRPLPITVASTR